MKLAWLANINWTPGAGNGYSVHSRKLRQAVEALGVEVTEDPRDRYDLGVYVMRPDYFFPAPGKPSVCFSACEMNAPTVHLSSSPTALVVPCEHNRKVWAPFFHGDIHVAPEGFCELMTYTERKKPEGADQMFVYLWHGNDFFGNRKGSGVMMEAWRDWYASGRMPNDVVLWMKTSEIQGPEVRFYNAAIGEESGTLQVPGVVTDVRHLPIADLVQLYKDSSAFISTSSGEGWCLPAADAAACGLPVIYPAHTAFLDYLSPETAYPLTALDQVPYWPLGKRAGDGPALNFGLWPRGTDIIRAMEEVYHNYPEALRRGKRASERMHIQYTWAQAAEKFIAICERYA
jgi:glycosyltransferase involved in cell wall biosynthesis